MSRAVSAPQAAGGGAAIDHTCLDIFSLNPLPPSHGTNPLDTFFQIPADNPHREAPPTINLAPGLDVCDFYGSSEKSEVWLNDATIECWVPPFLMGWEFYTILQPRPDGSFPLVLNPESERPIELLFGRPPGAEKCPSMLFFIVPAGQQYENPDGTAESVKRNNRKGRSSLGSKMGSQHPRATTPYDVEKYYGNIDYKGRSLHARLCAMCPAHIYDERTVIPDNNNWGLFVGPRHRSMVLLNKHRGRIDVHLLMLFSIDAVFRKCRNLVEATARLYEPLGTENHANSLFGDFDPLKAHCGLTSALIAEHVHTKSDGREDYHRLLGMWPPAFFVSNNSDNLRFLTPLETHQHRKGIERVHPLPVPRKLNDFPTWTKDSGEFTKAQRVLLRKYRTHIMPRTPAFHEQRWDGGVLSLFGFQNSRAEDKWSQMFGGCGDISFAGKDDSQHPAHTHDVAQRDETEAKPVVPEDPEALAPAWVSALIQRREDPGPNIHWRHSQDLVPGADFGEDLAEELTHRSSESEEDVRRQESDGVVHTARPRWSILGPRVEGSRDSRRVSLIDGIIDHFSPRMPATTPKSPRSGSPSAARRRRVSHAPSPEVQTVDIGSPRETPADTGSPLNDELMPRTLSKISDAEASSLPSPPASPPPERVQRLNVRPAN